MTNAENIQRNAEMSVGEMLGAAEEWYASTHSPADAETASTAVKLAAWLAVEAPELDGDGDALRTQPEATVVTTLQVTHVVRGIMSSELAQAIAATAEKCLRAGFAEHVLLGGHPDEIRTESVQVFTFDEPRIAAEGPEEAETPEGSAE